MKTKEELNALKAEVEELNRKLAELTEEELVQVAGGGYNPNIGNFPGTPCPTKDGGILEHVETRHSCSVVTITSKCPVCGQLWMGWTCC